MLRRLIAFPRRFHTAQSNGCGYNRFMSADDSVIDAYRKWVDLTLIRENLRRTPQERLEQLLQLQRFAEELRRAGDAARQREP